MDPRQSDSADQLKSYDLSEIELIFSGNAEGIKETLALYGKDLLSFLPKWQTALAHGDGQTMEKMSHTLIGSAGMCGAKRTLAAAQKVNGALRESGEASEALNEELTAAIDENLLELRAKGILSA